MSHILTELAALEGCSCLTESAKTFPGYLMGIENPAFYMCLKTFCFVVILCFVSRWKIIQGFLAVHKTAVLIQSCLRGSAVLLNGLT